MLSNARRLFAQLRSSRTGGFLIGEAPTTQRRRALVGVAVRFVNDDNWRESAITFDNAPEHVGRVLGHAGPISANEWVDIDITDELMHNPAIANGGSLELSLATSLFASVGAPDPDHTQEAAGR